MNDNTILIELLLAGFFATACLRAQMPVEDRDKRMTDFFRLAGRIERLRRSRWQWFALVAFMLVLRLQHQLPLTLELMVAIEFALFMAMPKASPAEVRATLR